MQINPVNSVVVRPVEGRRPEKAAEAAPAVDQAQFTLDNLRAALKEEPGVRESEVRRGRELFNNVKYPPAELIRSISKLVASYSRDLHE